MQLHFTNSGIIRAGLSKRNLKRVIALYERAENEGRAGGEGELYLAMQSGDIYRGELPVSGVFTCTVSGDEILFTQSIFGGNINIPLDAAREILAELDSCEKVERQAGSGAILYVESDEAHYAYRAAGLDKDAPLP